MLCAKFGDYCLDLSKLIFGGVILAAIMQLDINIVWLFVVGTVIVALTAYAGYILKDNSYGIIDFPFVCGIGCFGRHYLGNARIAERRFKKIRCNSLWLLSWLYLCGFVKANPPFRASPEKRFGCILFVLSNKIMGLIYFISAFGILMLVGIIWGIGELRKDASKR